MDQKQILKQMIEFNQTTFNNTFQAMMLLQEQFERVAQTAIDQANWLPAEGRKAIENWVEAYKTGRDQYKSYVDDSYKKVEKYFAD
jgi:gamma-glutamyl:cysteine ligase YbdK (ATP-grasp superfamily)